MSYDSKASLKRRKMSDQSLTNNLTDESALHAINEVHEIDSEKPYKSHMSTTVREAINLGHKCAALLGAKCVSHTGLSRSYGQASLRFTCR